MSLDDKPFQFKNQVKVLRIEETINFSIFEKLHDAD